MRIDGDLIRKMRHGTLDKETVIELLQNEELGVYAWRKREILETDPRFFVVSEESEKFGEVEKIEEKYNARFVEGQLKNGKQSYLMESLGKWA